MMITACFRFSYPNRDCEFRVRMRCVGMRRQVGSTDFFHNKVILMSLELVTIGFHTTVKLPVVFVGIGTVPVSGSVRSGRWIVVDCCFYCVFVLTSKCSVLAVKRVNLAMPATMPNDWPKTRKYPKVAVASALTDLQSFSIELE
jgi:hypothetical protein